MRLTNIFCFLALCFNYTISIANSVVEVEAWLETEVLLDPPIDGAVLTSSDLAKLEPWIPPGLIHEFDFPEMKVEIQEYREKKPHHNYTEATKKFLGQAAIKGDGSLSNYTAGQPFSKNQIEKANARDAGHMIAWNNIHRWQNYGIRIEEMFFAYVGAGKGLAPLDKEKNLNGGGILDRLLTMTWKRVYLNKLAMLPQQDYKMDVKDSDTRFYKEYMEFLSPFNVKGTKFVVERMIDPQADDLVNTYLPTERRVRRFSAKERSDSFMGSNGTFDDIEGFSGRVLDYTWEYLGEKRILATVDSRQTKNVAWYGPHSRFPDDLWQVRDTYVVKADPVWLGNPVKSRIMFIDKETFNISWGLIFNRQDQLWKTMQTVHKIFDDSSKNESDVSGFVAMNMIDQLANTATICSKLTPTKFPVTTEKQVKRVFSVSTLSEGQ